MHAICSFVGRLGTDVDVRQTGQDNQYTLAKGRVCIKRRVKNQGQWEDADSWVSVVAFGHVANSLKRCGKGDLLQVSGEFYSTEWTGRDGQTRHSISCVAVRQT
jgi:single-strand DNA-binding protein